MRIALAGNQNSGKTSLFNAITGKIEIVGNWPGVTVEKKEGNVKSQYNSTNQKIIAVDLPGCYSISPYTNEESVTRDYIIEGNVDVIVNIVDSTNLSRSLFFTLQLIELGKPVVIALNKFDLAQKKGIKIDIDLLSKLMNCPVVKTVSTKNKNNGLVELVAATIKLANEKGQTKTLPEKTISIYTKSKKELEEADIKTYKFVSDIVSQIEEYNENLKKQQFLDKADRIVAHKWLGIPIFAAIILLIFSISQSWLGPWLANGVGYLVNLLYTRVELWLGNDVSPILSKLLLDGIIGGVGAVMTFLPLIMVLFFCLALLEDCGYMSRVAVVMDRYFKKIGLSGKSVIPMVVGLGCSVPAIMSSRTIKDDRQRKTTAMLTPFIPCGAKLPVVALFASIFFSGKSWVGVAMYFMAIAVVIISGLIIRRITGDVSKSYFIIELPDYRLPSIGRAYRSMMSRAKEFIINAGTIILVSNVVIQLLQTFNWQFQVVADIAPETSILASISGPVALLLIPLGFGIWQFAAASITGFLAKENIVATLAVCFAITSFFNVESSTMISIFGITSSAALAYLVFNLFIPPCVAAVSAMHNELKSRPFFLGAIAFQFSMGYMTAFIVYQLGTLITTGDLGNGFVEGLVAVCCMVFVIMFMMRRGTLKSRTFQPSGII